MNTFPTPGHPLYGATLKLVRAQKHLDDIREILRGTETGYCELIPEKHSDEYSVLRINITPKPDSELSTIAGDFLFNVRASLDYIVWQLVILNGNKPCGRNLFPICSTSIAFSEAIGKHRRLDGISKEALALIESLQPYPGRENPLQILSKLHNTDKHRTINVTTAVASETQLTWSGPMHNPALDMIIGDEELRDGATFGNVGFNTHSAVTSAAFQKMQVKGYAAIFIAFDDPTAEELEPFRVDVVSQEILEFVRETVFPAFEPFFG